MSCSRTNTVFFDNLFACPELLAYLREKHIYAVCTLQQNRSRGCPIPTEKELKKKGRGSMEQRVDSTGTVVVCAWLDSRRVLTGSNYVGQDPVDECKRYDRKKKEEISVAHPAIVANYNRFMGGVDKADMLSALYRSKCRTRKWYMRIFTHLLSITAVNAWCIYRQIGGNGSLKDFIVDLSRTLMGGVEERGDIDEPRAKRPCRSLKASDVPKPVRTDKVHHWPYQMAGEAQRCKCPGCSRRTRFMCSKCQLYLCVVGSKCFLDFHEG